MDFNIDLLPYPISHFPRENSSLLPWSIYDKYKTHTFINVPFLFFHPFKHYYRKNWNSVGWTQNFHTTEYILKKAICENDFPLFVKHFHSRDIDSFID